MTQTNPLPINPHPTKKRNNNIILIAVAVVLVILIAVAVIFAKDLTIVSKSVQETAKPQTTLNQVENKSDVQTLNQSNNPNQPQSDPGSMNEDEKYLDDIMTSRPDADRYEELLR